MFAARKNCITELVLGSSGWESIYGKFRCVDTCDGEAQLLLASSVNESYAGDEGEHLSSSLKFVSMRY